MLFTACLQLLRFSSLFCSLSLIIRLSDKNFFKSPYTFKKWKIMSVGEVVEKLEASYSACGNVNVVAAVENSLAVPQ